MGICHVSAASALEYISENQDGGSSPDATKINHTEITFISIIHLKHTNTCMPDKQKKNTQ